MQHARITMTKQSPRIYVYKIIFLEVPHYYYGYHKEKIFNEYYMGSPVTNKDFWIFYTPIKEIIKEFPFTDEGYKAAREFENSLIKPVYNTDPLCLNEHCGGMLSLDACIKGGKKAGQKTYELGVGVHGISPEEQIENAKKAGQKSKELGVGIHARTKEQMTKDGKKGAQTNKENGTGIFSMSFESRSELGKRNGQQHYENGTGVCGLTIEQRRENGKKGGKKGGKKAAKIINSQVWECTVTGHRSTPGGLSRYQKSRNINTSNRIRIQ